ncbi:hypothetical protein CGLAMM_11485 [Acetobacteraceae bacterium EV16G]
MSLTRALTFSAEALGGSYSVGALEIANPDGALSGLLQSRVNDHLPVRIRAGRKDWDAARQIWRDPPYDATAPVFAGLGRNWQPGPTGFEVPLLDATYWLDTAMPTRSYGGGGGLDGDKNVVGRSHPRLRGMCRNITPILIDAVNLVYQLSDAEAEITAVYEGGFGGGSPLAGGLMIFTPHRPRPAITPSSIRPRARGCAWAPNLSMPSPSTRRGASPPAPRRMAC